MGGIDGNQIMSLGTWFFIAFLKKTNFKTQVKLFKTDTIANKGPLLVPYQVRVLMW